MHSALFAQEKIMPPGNQILSPATPVNKETKPLVATLHASLGQLGFVVPSTERDTQSFGNGTVHAVREFRQRFSLPDGDMLDPVAGRVMKVATAFTDGNRTVLRASIQESANAAPAGATAVELRA